jgi:hypothetical protein
MVTARTAHQLNDTVALGVALKPSLLSLPIWATISAAAAFGPHPAVYEQGSGTAAHDAFPTFGGPRTSSRKHDLLRRKTG